MNTKTFSPLLSQAPIGKTESALIDARWPQFSGVLLSIPATRKMIAAQNVNGMIDYTGEVLERRLDKK